MGPVKVALNEGENTFFVLAEKAKTTIYALVKKVQIYHFVMALTPNKTRRINHV